MNIQDQLTPPIVPIVPKPSKAEIKQRIYNAIMMFFQDARQREAKSTEPYKLMFEDPNDPTSIEFQYGGPLKVGVRAKQREVGAALVSLLDVVFIQQPGIFIVTGYRVPSADINDVRPERFNYYHFLNPDTGYDERQPLAYLDADRDLEYFDEDDLKQVRKYKDIDIWTLDRLEKYIKEHWNTINDLTPFDN